MLTTDEYRQHIEANTPTIQSTSADQSTPAFPSNQNGVSNVQRGASNTYTTQATRQSRHEPGKFSILLQPRLNREKSNYAPIIFYVLYSCNVFTFTYVAVLVCKIYSKSFYCCLRACA